ncbi:hypothetical protein [Aminobacter sp. DSM 101952]|uniref:hypothetical protein n=1 Tax=Aminobacter sp. DSM 101952 TaxID=2735891 RepID=UPI0012E3F6E9|nr:hypothetical protein [Aminobacter sp. DSM 101952]
MLRLLALDVAGIAEWRAEPDFPDLPMLAPSPLPATDQAALGEILADALFGEVIEISDLIPHLLAPSVEAAAGPVDVVATDMAGDAMVAMVPFTILFEEEPGHGTF